MKRKLKKKKSHTSPSHQHSHLTIIWYCCIHSCKLWKDKKKKGCSHCGQKRLMGVTKKVESVSTLVTLGVWGDSTHWLWKSSSNAGVLLKATAKSCLLQQRRRLWCESIKSVFWTYKWIPPKNFDCSPLKITRGWFPFFSFLFAQASKLLKAPGGLQCRSAPAISWRWEGGGEIKKEVCENVTKTLHIYLGLSATRLVIFSTSGMNTALMKRGGRLGGGGAVRGRIRAELLH